MKNLSILLVFWICITSCQQRAEFDDLGAEIIGRTTNEMTNVMIHDVTNPPLSARFFSYAMLAAYETVALHDQQYPSMKGKLNDFPVIQKPVIKDEYSYQLAAVVAMLEIAKKVQPSGYTLQEYETRLLDSCRTVGYSKQLLAASQQVGVEVAKQLLPYIKADKYNLMSSYPRYEPKEEKGSWYPTPPGYFPPVEPYFNTVRPFTLDSASQFKPEPPIAFSEDKNSPFFKLMHDVYQVKPEGEVAAIAGFWDCNPFALENKGHLMVGMKKISPSSHWMGITDIVCKQAGLDFNRTTLITMSVAIGLFDGFLACWDEKYRSNRIRPETAIRKYIDPHWKPNLQTPPFPEYLSGHSVISSSAAVILTHYLGDNFAYTDTVEERFGLKARHFKSFMDAAIESGISRFYGGIHFMDAIENGRLQGEQVGAWVIKNIGMQ